MDKRLEGLDLNLMTALHWLLTERNVTAAAGKLGLSQPAASRALSKLREIFDDPLLVKTGGEMAPTRLAERLQPAVAVAVERCREVFRISDHFEPTNEEGSFRIACVDYVAAFVGAVWATSVHPKAPKLTLEFINPTLECAREMATGKVDLCILPDLSVLDIPPTIDTDAFVQKRILEQDYVSAIRKNHPLAGKDIDLDTFVEMDHVLISPSGDVKGLVDDALSKLDRKRHIAYVSPSFLLGIPLVRYTDCVVTGPRPLLQMRTDALHLFTPPLELNPVSMYGVWHPNWTHDTRHQWVRDQLFQTMLNLAKCPFTRIIRDTIGEPTEHIAATPIETLSAIKKAAPGATL